MDIVSETGPHRCIRVGRQGEVCYIQLYRPEANNTINDVLVEEVSSALDACERDARIVVLYGLPQVFCFGADFKAIDADGAPRHSHEPGRHSEPLYDLWLKLATGSYISIAHVRGKVNAGGMGFVAACDIVLSEDAATYSLSELLFGLMPACVMPFLIRRVGFTKANYLTLMTSPVTAQQAVLWGLADASQENSEELLRRHLLRLRRVSKKAIGAYKRYTNAIGSKSLHEFRAAALEANQEVFADPDNIEGIKRFVAKGVFPWEQE